MFRFLQKLMKDEGAAGAGAGGAPATPPPATPPADGTPATPPPATPPADGTPATPPATPPTDSGTPAAPPTWPDDWREKYAGQDQTRLGVLKRYTSPQAALDALFAARDVIAKGQQGVAPLGENPTPEQLVEFRKAQGIPEKPTDYKLALSDGRVVGEADKPVIEKLLTELHGTHATPAQVSKVVDFYYSTIEDQIAERQAQDAEDKKSCEDALRAEYGNEYRRNLGLVKNFLQGAGGEGENSLFSILANARSPDGQLLLNNQGVFRALAGWAREAGPVGSFLPGGDDNALKSIEGEMSTLRGLMADSKSEYWTGPKADANQARYRELVELTSKLQQRKAA